MSVLCFLLLMCFVAFIFVQIPRQERLGDYYGVEPEKSAQETRSRFFGLCQDNAQFDSKSQGHWM